LETIKSLDIVTTISINEFQDPAAELQRANDTLFGNDSRRQKLLLALYNIRGLVGTANAGSGINTNLAKSAFVDKRIIQLTDFASLKPMTTMTVIQGKLEKIRNRKEEKRSLYGNDEEVTTTVVSEDQIKQAKDEIKNLKKQKQSLADEILELNIKTEIPLSDDVVETLTKEGII
jgi:uncharacterized protein YdcH (DUF465 family)